MKNFIIAVLAFVGAGFLVVDIAKAETVDVTAFAPGAASAITPGNHAIVAAARRYIGTNPTGNRFLWCMDFVNHTLARSGYTPTGSRQSRSILRHGIAVARADLKPGDIVWRSRGRRGGHVEIFTGWANPQKTEFRAITGNSCGPRGRRLVCIITRPAHKIHRARRMMRGT